ncbi:DNA-directed RNA polymerase subunit omega [Candidatus Margulisiibacteriota bacterium]
MSAKYKDKISITDINISNILGKVPNRFKLSIAVAKRARQIKEGAKELIEIDPDANISPVLIALKEIAEGKVDVVSKEDEIEETEILEKMEQQLEEEILEEEQQEQEKATKKKSAKEAKSKSKSKSLAA